MTVHHVFIEPDRLTPSGQTYVASLAVSDAEGDESFDILVSGSTDPEHDACRVLAARSLEGEVQFYFQGKPSLRFKDLRKAALKRVVETTKEGPRIGRWIPHPRSASRMPILPDTESQERPF